MMKIIIKLYPVLLSFFIIFYLFKNIKFGQLINTLNDTNILFIIFIIVIYSVSKIINTYRYSQIYKISDKFKLFFVLCYCNLMLSILPFRIGEFSYITNLKKFFKINLVNRLNGLGLIRIFDMIIIFYLFLIASIYSSAELSNGFTFNISLVFTLLLITVAVLVAVFILFRNQIKILIRSVFKNKIFVNKIFNFINNSVIELKKLNSKIIIILLASTFAYWLYRIFFGYLILIILGISITFFNTLFISCIIISITLIPIKTFANFGIFEAGWSYFLIKLGYESEIALIYILKFHLIILLTIIIYGLIGYFFIRKTNEIRCPSNII